VEELRLSRPAPPLEWAEGGSPGCADGCGRAPLGRAGAAGRRLLPPIGYERRAPPNQPLQRTSAAFGHPNHRRQARAGVDTPTHCPQRSSWRRATSRAGGGSVRSAAGRGRAGLTVSQPPEVRPSRTRSAGQSVLRAGVLQRLALGGLRRASFSATQRATSFGAVHACAGRPGAGFLGVMFPPGSVKLAALRALLNGWDCQCGTLRVMQLWSLVPRPSCLRAAVLIKRRVRGCSSSARTRA
jgi:hypothetical protein